MFTVIVLKENPEQHFDSFHFLGGQIEDGDEIFWYQWQDTDSVEDVVRSLQTVLVKHHMWKLVVWDGMESFYTKKGFMDDDLTNLIKVISGGGSKIQDALVQYSYPELIYGLVYINSEEKGKLEELKKAVEWNFPQNFRMFLWEVPDGSYADKNENCLCLNCAIYLLALNEIPINLIESRALYEMNVELNMEEFGECLEEWDCKLKSIEFELAKRQDEIIRAESGRLHFSELREKADQIWNEKRLANLIDEKCGESDIREYVLKFKKDGRAFYREIQENFDNISFDLRKQGTFPRKLLENELKYIEGMSSEQTIGEGLLSEEETRLLREEQNLLLHRIYSIKRLYFNSGDRIGILKNYRSRMEYDAFMAGVSKKYIYMIFILLAMEVGIVGPMMMNGQEWKMKIYAFAAAVIWTALIVFVSNLFRIFYWKECLQLNRLVRKWNKERDKICEYMKKTLSLVMKYRYYEQCGKDCAKRRDDIKQQKVNLELHKRVLMKRMLLCGKMQQMTEVAGIRLEGKADIRPVSVREVPDEHVYGLIRVKDRKALAELNGTGHYIKAGYKFIQALSLIKVRGFDA